MRTDQQAVRISLYAPKGRMGRAIAAVAETSDAFAIDPDHGDVLVDFSSPDGLRGSLDQAMSAAIPILVGTTGLNDGHHALIAEAAEVVPVLVAPNTSLGVALLTDLVEREMPEVDGGKPRRAPDVHVHGFGDLFNRPGDDVRMDLAPERGLRATTEDAQAVEWAAGELLGRS